MKILHHMTIICVCVRDVKCHLIAINQLPLWSIGNTRWKQKIPKSPMTFEIIWDKGLVRRGGRLLAGRVHLIQSFVDLSVGEYAATMRV